MSAFEGEGFLLARFERATHRLGTGEFPRPLFVQFLHLPGEALAFVLDLIEFRRPQLFTEFRIPIGERLPLMIEFAQLRAECFRTIGVVEQSGKVEARQFGEPEAE